MYRESQLSWLRELDLAGNLLTILPEALGRLSHLGRLDLSRNHLTALPEALGRLSNLNQTTQHWHTDSVRKRAVPTYLGRQVYESHVD